MRLAWKGFLPWLQHEHPADCGHLEEALNTIAGLHDNVSQALMEEVKVDPSCIRVCQLFQQYIDTLREGHGLATF